MKKKILKDLKAEIYKIVKRYDAYLIQSCGRVSDFTGNDIDTFYKKKNDKINFSKKYIIRNKNNNNLRLHLNHYGSTNFLTLDIEELTTLPEKVKNIFEKNFNKKVFCKITKLNHLDNKSIAFYKLYKYFCITIHSYYQLKDLKIIINKLSKEEFNLLLKSAKEALPYQFEIIKKFLFWEFKRFKNNKETQLFFSQLIHKRHLKRQIFSGQLTLKNIIFSKKFAYALLFGNFARWKNTHNPMPAISIIGNDGSGKSTAIEFIKKNYSKMDPLILNMKSTPSLVPFFGVITKFLKKILNLKLIKKIFFLSYFFSVFGELILFIDKYLKFKIGMAWADSGNGLTIFERYPTDRVRGEFPNKKNRLFPLEQFFPLPDGFIYLDVKPNESIKRKKKDNHTLDEMISKRKNYLSLLREFDEVKIISSTQNKSNQIKIIKNYIFILSLKKKKQIFKKQINKRVKWKKNFNRKLAGNKMDRVQKDSFILNN